MSTEHKPHKIPPRSALRWRATRRDIYDEEGYVIETISRDAPLPAPPTQWALRGHWTRNELVDLREALNEVLD